MADVAPEIPLHGALCFLDAQLPLCTRLTLEGYPLLYPKALARRINAAGPLTPEKIQGVAARLAERLPSA